MRDRLVAATCTAAALTLLPTGAQAATVIDLGHGRPAVVREDPFLTTSADYPLAADAPAARRAAHASRHGTSRCQVCAALRRLARTGAISLPAYRHYRATYATAVGALRGLAGTRAGELGAVIDNLRQIAGAGGLSASRAEPLFETIERNRQWWTTGPLLAPYQRVEFSGSQLVWEYYPGQGIELQVLANFGKADGLYTAGRSQYPNLRALLAELSALAVQRGGGLAWEYYFRFDGGAPPWISAMAQGTALEAFTRAYQAFGDSSYLDLAHRALAVLRVGPPVGVGAPTALGRRYLQYSFAPGEDILNAFLQALIGIYDYAHASGDPLATALFANGDAQARSEVPGYDTGAWSLYQRGLEDSLSYHLLVTGFLQELCRRTRATVYCATAQRFQTYVKTAPRLALLTARLRRRTPGSIRFRLSKYSHVGIVLVRGRQTLLATSAHFGYGVRAFSVPALAPGTYAVRLAATDLAGNFSRIRGTLSVRAAPHRRKR